MDLNEEQRKHVAGALKEAANLVLAGFVFGYVFATRWKWYFPILGIGVYFILMSLSLLFLRRKK